MEQEISFKVVKKDVEEAIVQELHIQMGHKTSVCLLILNTGKECVGSYTQMDRDNVDVSVNKKKARKAATKVVNEYLLSVNEWRRAVYESEKAMAEARKQQEAQKQGASGVEEPEGEK